MLEATIERKNSILALARCAFKGLLYHQDVIGQFRIFPHHSDFGHFLLFAHHSDFAICTCVNKLNVRDIT
jgi:hypothetical protein